jgi:hypothetical protein
MGPIRLAPSHLTAARPMQRCRARPHACTARSSLAIRATTRTSSRSVDRAQAQAEKDQIGPSVEMVTSRSPHAGAGLHLVRTKRGYGIEREARSVYDRAFALNCGKIVVSAL